MAGGPVVGPESLFGLGVNTLASRLVYDLDTFRGEDVFLTNNAENLFANHAPGSGGISTTIIARAMLNPALYREPVFVIGYSSGAATALDVAGGLKALSGLRSCEIDLRGVITIDPLDISALLGFGRPLFPYYAPTGVPAINFFQTDGFQQGALVAGARNVNVPSLGVTGTDHYKIIQDTTVIFNVGRAITEAKARGR